MQSVGLGDLARSVYQLFFHLKKFLADQILRSDQVTEDVVYEWLNGLGGTSSTKVP
jgi:hypothetical protein